MSGEIKEILESLDKISKAEYYPEDLLTYKECHLLLDYITNLQQIEQDHQKLNGELREENKRLQKENEKLNNIIKNIEQNTIESDFWDCEVYKGHKCRYSSEDYSCDSCIFCGEPDERK